MGNLRRAITFTFILLSGCATLDSRAETCRGVVKDVIHASCDEECGEAGGEVAGMAFVFPQHGPSFCLCTEKENPQSGIHNL